MPYINHARRRGLDPALQKLWDCIFDDVAKPLDEVKGDVNYCFTKILVTLLEKYGARYHTLSNIRAIPMDVAEEFHAQYMRPYEDAKKLLYDGVEPLKILVKMRNEKNE